MTSWWFDERAHAGPEHLDTDYVDGYERKAGFDPAEDLAALERHGIGATSTVVDLGAGTGVLAIAIAPRCREVIAVDVSPAMVAALRARVDRLALDNVRVVEGGLLAYDFDAGGIDAVYSRNVLHHLPDFWKVVALRRVAAALRPGGVLRIRDLVYDFEPAGAQARLDAWFAGAAEDPADGFTAAELANHVRTEFSTYSWLLEPMLERAGFEIIELEYRKGIYAAYTCRRRRVA
jgi:SAM-dependent methyltransferase